MKLESVDKHLKEKLKDPYFKELYELEEQKLDIVKRIIDYRVKHGLNQKQLAERVAVTQQHISKIESGDFANVMTLEKVLLAIGYTVQIKAIHLSPTIADRIRKAIHSRAQFQAA